MAEAQPEAGPEEGAAPAEEAAQAVEADPAGAAGPVGVDEPIGTCTGLVYSELRVQFAHYSLNIFYNFEKRTILGPDE